MKPFVRHMKAAGMSAAELASVTGLDRKLVKAIAEGNYTPGPSERQSLAAARGVPLDDISCDHAVPVEYLRGNGPQTGRPT